MSHITIRHSLITSIIEIAECDTLLGLLYQGPIRETSGMLIGPTGAYAIGDPEGGWFVHRRTACLHFHSEFFVQFALRFG